MVKMKMFDEPYPSNIENGNLFAIFYSGKILQETNEITHGLINDITGGQINPLETIGRIILEQTRGNL